ncbi:hypothetical protein T484DRAFT_1895593, partial [Baffinella frigidus]
MGASLSFAKFAAGQMTSRSRSSSPVRIANPGKHGMEGVARTILLSRTLLVARTVLVAGSAELGQALRAADYMRAQESKAERQRERSEENRGRAGAPSFVNLRAATRDAWILEDSEEGEERPRGLVKSVSMEVGEPRRAVAENCENGRRTVVANGPPQNVHLEQRGHGAVHLQRGGDAAARPSPQCAILRPPFPGAKRRLHGARQTDHPPSSALYS